MAITLKIPTKTVDDNFVLQDFKDDFNTISTIVNETSSNVININNEVMLHLADMSHIAGKIYAYNNIGGAL